MKKHILKLLALALCAVSLLNLTALAEEAVSPEEADTEKTAAEDELPAAPAAVLYWGTVTKQEDGSLLLDSANPDGYTGEVVVRVPEGTPFVDGVTGEPMNLEEIKDGDSLHIWVGPAMTMSLPPQTNAAAIIGNVPADGAAPLYSVVTGEAIFPAPGGEGERRIPYAGGELTANDATVVAPYLTRNIVTLEDLIPGTAFLAWTGEDGKAERVLVFPYGYRGYLEASEDGIRLSGEALEGTGRVFEDEYGAQLYLPLRIVAESAGFDVKWVSGRGAVVSLAGEERFVVSEGGDTAQRVDDPYSLLSPCVVEKGVTYLPAADLVSLLELYLCA